MYTPLEAFKTDVFYDWGSYFFPAGLQINSQLLAVFAVGLIFFGGIGFIGLRSHFWISEFFISQLGLSFIHFFTSFVTLTLLVGGFNITGLVPYQLTLTSQIIINMALSFGTVIGLVWMGVNEEGVYYLYRFVPKNVPAPLVPLLFGIEIISFLMRIFSMSIRLFANMVAGHSLLHLLVSLIKYVKLMGVGKWVYIILGCLLIFVLGGWILFELFVALLQAYVFVLLYLLYIAELSGH